MVKHTDSVVRTIATCWGGPVVVLTSPISAFTGFDSYAWITIGVQSLEGLLVSRLLKYTDSAMRTTATRLRGPVVVMISPISTHIGSSAASGLIALEGLGGGGCEEKEGARSEELQQGALSRRDADAAPGGCEV